MSKVAVITDSTTYLPEDIITKLKIHVIPIIILWGEETILDGVDIQPDEFYSRMSATDIMPTTSQPTPAAFQEKYQTLLDQGFEVLSIHISHKLSGTLTSATQAKGNMPGQPIEIVDGMSASMGTGWAVIEAARAAQSGASLLECKQIAEKSISKINTLFIVDTLEYLHKGGRIGGASRFIGTALNFKPILVIDDGAIEALERVRTSQKAKKRLLEIMAQEITQNCKLAVLHANAAEAAEEYMKMALEKFNPAESLIASVSPGIGVHLGPGTLGISILTN